MSNNIELYIIKLFYNYNIYNKYNKYIINIKETSKEIAKLFSSLSDFHEHYPDRGLANTAEFEVYFHTQFPALNQRDREAFNILFRLLDETTVNSDLVEGYINAHRERLNGHRLALIGLDVAEGRKSWKDAQSAFNEVLEASDAGEVKEDLFVSSSLGDIHKRHQQEKGLRWPLDSLNKMMGSLRKGNYGFIFARPETGKTTFLAHVASHMAGQTDRPVIWFNNEQEGHEVQGYCYRAALGLTNRELYATIEENEKKYKEITGDRIRIYDDASIHRKDVEDILRRYGAGLIIFDQIDKIKGFDSDRNDLELGAIYQWARELAKRYAPVIGVCQAGESGANKRYLTMEDVVNAKTSKQAEADWILGIGKLEQEGYENVRHFHLCKNKLIGDDDSLPELRHGKSDVLILPEIARYKDT